MNSQVCWHTQVCERSLVWVDWNEEHVVNDYETNARLIILNIDAYCWWNKSLGRHHFGKFLYR